MTPQTIINLNITVRDPQELKTYLRELEQESQIGPLESAIEAAKGLTEDFVPFTYEDVGLTIDKRNYRRAFRAWAADNDIEYIRHIKGPGKGGSQGAMFYPFCIDESGQKILATFPEEGVEG